MRTHRRLIGLLLFFTFLGTLYSVTTPLFEAPDEVWHYGYVRYLVDERTLPALTEANNEIYQEVAQPPLYYAVAALTSGIAPDDDLPELMWHNPGFGYQAGGTVDDNKNMLVHTEREHFPWRGAVLAIRLARFTSLLFGLLTVVAAWGLGQEAFPGRPMWALSTASVVGLVPQFLFISGVVSNDSAAAALSTLALWVIARACTRGPTARRSLVIGLLIGLAALVKVSNLLLGPLALVALALVRHPKPRRIAPVFGHWTLVVLTILAVGGWWYLRNAILYRDPFALAVHVDTPWGRSAPASLADLLAQLPKVYKSFWGAFGWGHIEFPLWVYLALGMLVVASLVGWARAFKTHGLTGSGAVFLLAASWGTLVLAALLEWMRKVEAPHGRLLFPAIGAWAVLLVGGWAGLVPSGRGKAHAHWMPAVLLASLTLLSCLTPWLVIRPAFALPSLLPPAEAATSVVSTDLVYGGTARLLGAALERTSAAPGETLAVRACWEAVAPISLDYTVFVHVIGQENVRIAERHTYPGLGRFPTTLWPVGQAFCDVYHLRLEEWAPAPELYDVIIGLFDAAAGDRLAVRDSNGTDITYPVVARVRVAPSQPLDVSPQFPLDYQLGHEITLAGYRLSGSIQASAPLTITLYWRADGRSQEDYTVLVHLLDEAGRIVTQHDGPPRYGRYPTSAWQAGDVVPDEHVLDVPSLPPGQHVRLVVGMYRADTLDRLQVVGPAGPLPDGLIQLPVDSP